MKKIEYQRVQMGIRIRPELYHALKIKALEQGMTVTMFLIRVMEQLVAK